MCLGPLGKKRHQRDNPAPRLWAGGLDMRGDHFPDGIGIQVPQIMAVQVSQLVKIKPCRRFANLRQIKPGNGIVARNDLVITVAPAKAKKVIYHGVGQESHLAIGIDPKRAMPLRQLCAIGTMDQYFIDKKLYPNVDFYSGIILKAMGFPTSMFTVLFAVARTVGWVAQWNEMITDPMQRIGRPRQLYTGPAQRGFVGIDKR